MKPILTYYGGKSRFAAWIIMHFPDVDWSKWIYAEPFFGGGAVLYNKKKMEREYINDKNNALYRLYRVVQTQPDELIKRFENFTLLRAEYKRSYKVVNGIVKPDDEIDFAYCVLLHVDNSRGSGFNSTGIRVDLSEHGSNAVKVFNNKIKCYPEIFKRLKEVVTFNVDAVDFIKKFDKEYTFFYLDPPYPGADQKSYGKYIYTQKDFNNLIEVLRNIKGKFLLSCYKRDWMKLDGFYTDKKLVSTMMLSRLTGDNSKISYIDSIRKEYLISNYEFKKDRKNFLRLYSPF